VNKIAKLADYQVVSNSASLAKIDGQSFTITEIEDSHYTQGDEITKGVKLTMKEFFSIDGNQMRINFILPVSLLSRNFLIKNFVMILILVKKHFM